MNRTFEWGVVTATFLSVLSIVPHHCIMFTSFTQIEESECGANYPKAKYPYPSGACGAQ